MGIVKQCVVQHLHRLKSFVDCPGERVGDRALSGADPDVASGPPCGMELASSLVGSSC